VHGQSKTKGKYNVYMQHWQRHYSKTVHHPHCELRLIFKAEEQTRLQLLLIHPFNCLFSRTTCVSWYQKGKTSLDLNEARDDGVLGRQWHQLDHMQTICTSLQTDNHTHQHLISQFFTGRMLFLTPSQQCQILKAEQQTITTKPCT